MIRDIDELRADVRALQDRLAILESHVAELRAEPCDVPAPTYDSAEREAERNVEREADAMQTGPAEPWVPPRAACATCGHDSEAHTVDVGCLVCAAEGRSCRNSEAIRAAFPPSA